MATGVIMGLLFFGAILANTIQSGVNFGKRKNELQQAMEDAQQKFDIADQNYKAVLTANAVFSAEIKQSILDGIDVIGQLRQKINLAREEYNASLLKTKIAGVIFVAFIGIVLILKKFNVI